MKTTFDSFDLIVCVALWGGFVTGNWFPFIAICGISFWLELERIKAGH